MSLIQIASSVVTSATSSVSLTGISDNSAYMLVVNNFVPSTDAQDMKIRVIESGTPNSTSNYDIGALLLRADTSFGGDQNTNDTSFDCSTAIGNATGECANWVFYIYKAFNNSEPTFFTQETVQLSHTALLIGRQGGCIFTSDSQVEGVQMFAGSGKIQSGSFGLYKVV